MRALHVLPSLDLSIDSMLSARAWLFYIYSALGTVTRQSINMLLCFQLDTNLETECYVLNISHRIQFNLY